MTDEEALIEKQYRLAIDARDKLNDNYHKWMTFYYVANGAILVAITTLYKEEGHHEMFPISLIGIVICIFWYLSCKGYNYWSHSWINIIIAHEKRVVKHHPELMVYSVFSKDIAKKENKSWQPTQPANISTPKLTMLFAFTSILAWMAFSLYKFWAILPPSYNVCCKISIVSSIVIIVVLILTILPKFVRSRKKKTHKLI